MAYQVPGLFTAVWHAHVSGLLLKKMNTAVNLNRCEVIVMSYTENKREVEILKEQLAHAEEKLEASSPNFQNEQKESVISIEITNRELFARIRKLFPRFVEYDKGITGRSSFFIEINQDDSVCHTLEDLTDFDDFISYQWAYFYRN